MTEKLQPLSTQLATPSQNVFPLNNAVSTQDALPQKAETVEEEPYTIKCICNFSDDDGNTILCETCETWQHIECYYPDNAEDPYRADFVHSCADCKPRPLNKVRAIGRQRARLSVAAVEEAQDKKPKRPPAKSHKKKAKPTELQLNGHSATSDSSKHISPLEQSHPAKKPRISHKTNHSVSSQAAKQSPSHGTSRTNPHGHPPSPVTTPPDLTNEFEIHKYSDGFLTLYDDRNIDIVQGNSFANLDTPKTMALWLHDHDRLQKDTGVDFKDAFNPGAPHASPRPQSVNVGSKELSLSPDTLLRWQFLTTTKPVEKNVPLIELNGQVGLQKDYCADPENRWDELSSPLPFVFFHPMLPLYIDTRKEGSRARYVRRSCKPNAQLDTFLVEDAQYHFWLVSDRPIGAQEQITLPWDFRLPNSKAARMLRALGLEDDETTTHRAVSLDQGEYVWLATWVHRILSEYGGCACDLGNNCAFVKFHRTYQEKVRQKANAPQKRKPRKPKTHTISPTSTGHATNSRAVSEGRPDEAPENDTHSASGSSRSKPPSRDMTPARQGSFDTLGILTEPTDRDKRKVQMVEDTFRRMEQQQPPRKKKRVWDSTSNSSSSRSKARNSVSHAAGPPNGTAERTYVDAAAGRGKSGSPSSATSPGTAHHPRVSSSRRTSAHPVSGRASSSPHPPSYQDAAVQTDTIEGQWYSQRSRSPTPRRRVVSLSRRLLENRHRQLLDEENRRERRQPLPTRQHTITAMDIDTQSPDIKASHGSPSSLPVQSPATSKSLSNVGDTSMPDAPTQPTHGCADSVATNGSTTLTGAGQSKIKSPELRVVMPPVPAFSSPNSASATTTPISATGSIVQSPFSTTNIPSPFPLPSVNGIAPNPSPVKKKMSLSDYKSKQNRAAAARPFVRASALKAPTTNGNNAKHAAGADVHEAADSPTTDKASGPNPSEPLKMPAASSHRNTGSV